MTSHQELSTTYPDLCKIDDPAWQAFLREARVAIIPAKQTVFYEGDACSYYHLILSGSIRVQKIAENGREIVLYRVKPGETCILTTSCALSSDQYPAEGITENEVRAVSIPMERFETLLTQSAAFRQFVFGIYSHRIADLIMLVEEVTFGRMDARLAQCLLKKAHERVVTATHQELAAELGTAREVVSRLLKEFEKRDIVALSRGSIEICQPQSLDNLADRTFV